MKRNTINFLAVFLSFALSNGGMHFVYAEEDEEEEEIGNPFGEVEESEEEPEESGKAEEAKNHEAPPSRPLTPEEQKEFDALDRKRKKEKKMEEIRSKLFVGGVFSALIGIPVLYFLHQKEQKRKLEELYRKHVQVFSLQTLHAQLKHEWEREYEWKTSLKDKFTDPSKALDVATTIRNQSDVSNPVFIISPVRSWSLQSQTKALRGLMALSPELTQLVEIILPKLAHEKELEYQDITFYVLHNIVIQGVPITLLLFPDKREVERSRSSNDSWSSDTYTVKQKFSYFYLSYLFQIRYEYPKSSTIFMPGNLSEYRYLNQILFGTKLERFYSRPHYLYSHSEEKEGLYEYGFYNPYLAIEKSALPFADKLSSINVLWDGASRRQNTDFYVKYTSLDQTKPFDDEDQDNREYSMWNRRDTFPE